MATVTFTLLDLCPLGPCSGPGLCIVPVAATLRLPPAHVLMWQYTPKSTSSRSGSFLGLLPVTDPTRLSIQMPETTYLVLFLIAK